MQHITFKNKSGFSKKMKKNWKESVLIFNQKWREGGVLSPFFIFFQVPPSRHFSKTKNQKFLRKKKFNVYKDINNRKFWIDFLISWQALLFITMANLLANTASVFNEP